jgi:GT2 family glycosyltransferase
MSTSTENQDASHVAVSVIVVTHNNESIIGDCLESIEAGAALNSHELIVVDSGSSDSTTGIASAHPSRPRLIALERNVGFAAASNEGIRASRGRLISLVNSDAFPDPGSIDRLVRAIDELPRAGIVGGLLRYPSGELQPSVGRFPSLRGGLWVALFLHRAPLTARLDLGINAHPVHYRSRRRVDWVTGAFCIARRAAGLIPEESFMYGEDVAWASSSHARGLEVWFEPAASAVHVGRATVDQSQAAGFAQRRRVQFELAWFGRRGSVARLAARGVIVLHALLRLLAYSAKGVLRGNQLDRVREYRALLRAATCGGRTRV